MGILDNLQPIVLKVGCRVAYVLSSLDKNDQAILLNALANPHFGNASLENALNKRGVKLSKHAIAKHRMGSCDCVRES